MERGKTVFPPLFTSLLERDLFRIYSAVGETLFLPRCEDTCGSVSGVVTV
ncbi:hypothetical protein [Sulfuracidifex tepidarius]|nr:hypothetical protein [Sulfuracidifex tepidarius]